MIDWYMILFLAAGIIIFVLNKVAEHRTPHEYLLLGGKYGIKQGTILLWASFFGGYSLFMPAYFVYHFDLLISVGYFLCFSLFIYFVTAGVLRKSQMNGVNEPVLTQWYRNKFTATGFRFFLPLLIVANLDGLLLQLTLANKLFRLWFPQQPGLFVALILLFCVIIAGLGGMFTIYRTVHLLLFICGFAFLFVPLFLYLKDGIHPIFEAYLTFKNNDQGLGWADMLTLFAALPLAFIGWLLTNSFFVQVLMSIKGNYRIPSLKLSIFCAASIPASILIYGIYMVSKYHPDSFFLFSSELMRNSSGIILFLISLVWLSGVVHSLVISLYSMASLFLYTFPNRWHPAKKIRIMYLMVMVLSLLVYISQYWLVNYVTILFVGYLLFYLTVSFPLRALVGSDKKYSYGLASFIALFWCLGIILFLVSQSVFLAVKMTILFSVVCTAGLKLSNFSKMGNILQK
ncbi:hypothetical protein [Neobacillus niacini]|uniref:hypothetical protein n=1 Tax=Neobacillus niacini TaxID=86668 RepID=UPI0021CB3ABC|nr:hypothetical protein [Neobacillus niacini]MCM3766286.1 hypothetical protein [Neobacillus niacini]